MVIVIEKVLDATTLARVQRLLAGAPFVDGSVSAGMAAAAVKHNQEVAQEAAHLNALNALVMRPLVEHRQFQLAALPHRIAAPYYARYQPGMAYGLHVDDPIMGADHRYRSDLSVTVFLNQPDDYDGGELEMQTAFGRQAVKLPAGDAVVYPASSVHRVTKVDRGERLVAVTWIQSMVRTAEQRAILYDLGTLRETALLDAPTCEDTRRLDRSYVNLLRLWAEI